ncbi:hypothetical protein PC41400_24765 [Paenibacillus chitinolyticus]|uniref:Uncharacterized protein n=1 Tax=Paenibacillus chitinolyticus TaxID=79263 RepID=A0A410X286_9BACL|nr:hypothetical protein [Paenibacillus chitinolyticus]MCY9593551.1 hypothetical protein [Paenibacillus chitinolyticus]MCY9597522.1 hypothetical protein [Paenibacillus chitinolyticus]QAV20719.1 hypothetical protein PC41400_24765 [Paenibacillus chitinolyticus]
MKRKYARAQIDYLAAKEQFLAASQQADKKLNDMRQDGAEIGQKEMEDAIERSGFHKAFNELRQAENRLIEWSHFTIKNEGEFKENKAAFEKLYNEVKTKPEARAVLVDMAMRLEAEA